MRFIHKNLAGVYHFALLYALLFLLTAPWPHGIIPCPGEWLRPITGAAADWTGRHVFGLAPGFTAALHSDSIGLYLHLFNLLLPGLVLFIFVSVGHFRKKDWQPAALSILRFFLIYQLLLYAWDKIFKWQFFKPEPNTLYSTLGETSPDLLYWSTMGVSRPYVMALGFIELIAAGLLVFRRTQKAGAVLAIMILGQVVLVNFSFDISVKVFSLFLLLIGVLLLQPEQKAHSVLPLARTFLTGCTVALLFVDSLHPYIQTKNFNDDSAPRPFLHGAYDVEFFIKNSDTLAPLLTDTFRWRRAFVHRRGYFIVQSMNDAMQDFEMNTDTATNTLWLSQPGDTTEQAWEYRADGRMLLLRGWIGEDSVSVLLRRLEEKALPAVNASYHWTTEP